MSPTQRAPEAPIAPIAPPPPPPPTPPLSPDQADVLSQQAAARADADLRALQAAQAADAGAPAVARATPRTAQELAGLRNQREELSNQLRSAQGRRRDVARALERADNPANRAGLEQRLGVLDRRIAQIENDIAETGRLLTTASPALVAQSERFSFPDRGPPPGAIAIVFIMFVLFPMALALARRAGRRTRDGASDPALRDASARLARLEQAVDAIAVEVERVSEGQRFVTRLLAESRAPAETAPALNRYRPD